MGVVTAFYHQTDCPKNNILYQGFNQVRIIRATMIPGTLKSDIKSPISHHCLAMSTMFPTIRGLSENTAPVLRGYLVFRQTKSHAVCVDISKCDLNIYI